MEKRTYMKTPYQEEENRNTAIRLIKKKKGINGLPTISVDSDFLCELFDDPHFFYETESEYVFFLHHFILKDACLASITVRLPATVEIISVLCEGQELQFFSINKDEISFSLEISGLSGRCRTLDAHTLIREPGLTLRIEENDKNRRSGVYRSGTYPELQIIAANHYMFAMREILHFMELPHYLNKEKLGYLLILGFETYNEVHGDYPPHWHIIFRWPYFCGSLAPHIYIGDDGKMLFNRTSVDGIPGLTHQYQNGEWCYFVDYKGRNVMAISVLEDGSMAVTKPNDGIYIIHPFNIETGVQITKDDCPIGFITTKNDIEKGIFTCYLSSNSPLKQSYEETITYDHLLGTFVCNTIKEIRN